MNDIMHMSNNSGRWLCLGRLDRRYVILR